MTLVFKRLRHGKKQKTTSAKTNTADVPDEDSVEAEFKPPPAETARDVAQPSFPIVSIGASTGGLASF